MPRIILMKISEVPLKRENITEFKGV